MIVKTMARKMGLNSSSNGQLTKTDLAAGGLRGFPVATSFRPLPQFFLNYLGRLRPLATHRRDLDPVIHHGTVFKSSIGTASQLLRRHGVIIAQNVRYENANLGPTGPSELHITMTASPAHGSCSNFNGLE